MSQEQPPERFQLSRKQVILGLVAVFAVFGAMNYFVQTLNIARPRMAADLDGMSLYSYSISVPALAAAFVTLIFGKFSDVYGRRIMLLVSLGFFLVGVVLSGLSQSFIFFIAATSVARVGSSAVMMLGYSVLGDMYQPAERSKWVGLLNIPAGTFALFGPTLGGWMVDNLSWRYIFWMSTPLLVICVFLVHIGVPCLVKRVAHKIDVRGCILVAVAASTMILGLSFAGSTYPWASKQVVGLLGVSLVFWILFLRTEARAREPILDPQVLRNRTFMTVAVATLLLIFAQIAMMMYFPMFLQGVQSISATRSGQIITPFSVLFSFMGVPAGFLLARTKRYKWIYIVSFSILAADMIGLIFFTAGTPILWSVLAATMAGLGLGTIPTVNTMVVQNSVPKRLLGVVMGAIFFAVSIGGALAPALLGSAMNAAYAKKLATSLPEELRGAVDEATIDSIGNSRVLLSKPAMAALEETFNKMGGDGPRLFQKTVQAIHISMEAALRSIFWMAAIATVISLLLICTVPEISLEKELPDKTGVAS